MRIPAETSLIDAVRSSAVPLTADVRDCDEALALIGDARFVLLGEATHGTHEFYRARALLTRRLIEEEGFSGVAVEADWPDAYRVNRFVRGDDEDPDAVSALADFRRFPNWMWRNADVLDFVAWLREHNEGHPERTAGFYGMDLYSLHSSLQAVIAYLDREDPEAAKRARLRYDCFDAYGSDVQAYGSAASSGEESCEKAVLEQLKDLQRTRLKGRARDDDEAFFAERNAQLVKNAEAYYRAMFRSSAESWNLRDGHMVETLEALDAHLSRTGPLAKLVVWAHNSHLGDARATSMAGSRELNVGQLMREKYPDECVLIGFTTYDGTVTAATHWDGEPEHKRVKPALEGSYEALFHQVAMPRFFLSLRGVGEGEALAGLTEPRLERAIGVIYRPLTERVSHYFRAHLAKQFDGVFHFDRTRAVVPLDTGPIWRPDELPDTYPSAL